MSKFSFYLKTFLCGIAFGVANVIPGVSGGTMLVVFGIYDKLTEAISGIKAIFKNIGFLISFCLGAGTGILGFAFVITWLFEQFGVQTNMFFIGLILGSVPLIVRTATKTEKPKPLCILPFIIGLAAVVGLTMLEGTAATESFSMTESIDGNITTIAITNNSDRAIESWSIEIENGGCFDVGYELTGAEVSTNVSTFDKIKQLFGAPIPEQLDLITGIEGVEIEAGETYCFSYSNSDADSAAELPFTVQDMSLTVSYKMDVMFFMTMLAALFIAAVAMIIPGVSGSFVMMLLGVYSTVIAALKDFNLMIIIPCAIGAVLGIILGARLMSTLLKKYSLMVYSLIMGLVIGSVYAILPQGFGFNIETGYGFVTLFCGVLVSVLIDKIGKPSEEK